MVWEWDVHHTFMCLHTWSPVDRTVWKFAEPQGVGVSGEEVSLWDGTWHLIPFTTTSWWLMPWTATLLLPWWTVFPLILSQNEPFFPLITRQELCHSNIVWADVMQSLWSTSQNAVPHLVEDFIQFWHPFQRFNRESSPVLLDNINWFPKSNHDPHYHQILLPNWDLQNSWSCGKIIR